MYYPLKNEHQLSKCLNTNVDGLVEIARVMGERPLGVASIFSRHLRCEKQSFFGCLFKSCFLSCIRDFHDKVLIFCKSFLLRTYLGPPQLHIFN